jgi:RHH-type proline utilization regulon transcriptional repressor/proline dehydrogenase/delta 1-pyrroline-5-carboxylate dehydrogenase
VAKAKGGAGRGASGSPGKKVSRGTPAKVRRAHAEAVAGEKESTADRVSLPGGATDPARDARVEARTQEIGEEVWKSLHRRQPSLFERRWWDDRILGVAMADESVKVQMFRFVDVLPRLKSHQEITRHLQEYFDEIREKMPWAVELVKFGIEHLRPDSVLSRALAYNARRNASRMAQRFIAGSNVGEVFQAVNALRRQGFAFTLDLLGEAVISESEAEAYQRQYLDLIRGLAEQLNRAPELPQIDCDHVGPIPRVNVSVKLSALVSHFRPIDPVGTAKAVKERLRPLLREAQANHAYVHVDMEQYAYKDLSLTIFKEILLEDEFREFADVGIVIQAYLHDAERDLQELLTWVKQRGTPVWVRLVKGAYWDYETVTCATHNWPVPVFEEKWQSDENYEKQTRFLLDHYESLRPAFGSHNLRSLSHAVAYAEETGVPSDAFEIQMLYGMAGEQAQVFAEMGHRVRIYTPFGELMPGMAYLVRRLLENTSNDSFLRHSYDDRVQIEDLLMKPSVVKSKTPSKSLAVSPAFVNEPHTDFSREHNREAMQRALDAVAEELGEDYSIVIAGKSIQTRKWITSRNPSRKDQIVGRVAAARTDDALAAIEAARRAFGEWSKVDPSYRAEYLELMAREMETRKFELSAWQVYECGKPWDEADADVAEAIDFCRYYAQKMRQMATGEEFDLPGEENCYFYRPRGVAVVIAPWNFPLAILTGMTAAALVTGNTVVMKPAEQSSVIGAKLMEIIHAAGIPDGVVNFLPGVGEEIGPILVGSPEVDLIAFTGSRPVGLSICETAGQTHAAQQGIKHVVAELGGKNAIIVDNDADLDEAVVGVLQSAFGYAGQKCSACSRVIVLADAYDEFVKRLVEAAKALKIGPADDPGTLLGPVIDDEAAERIREYIEIGQTEGKLLYAGDVGPLAKEGSYVGPHIFVDVPPNARIAQEEIFGPVLVVFKAKNFSEALNIANGTDYALTGGCYSRSPANLKRVRQEFLVGNLYLNRPITGALVARQPFGGFKMSGVGSKAGGPDYLTQFLIPVNITENTMRRGFAPPSEGE